MFCMVLPGECLGGALWWKDLLQLAEEVGFSPPRLVTAKIITVGNKELQEVLGTFPRSSRGGVDRSAGGVVFVEGKGLSGEFSVEPLEGGFGWVFSIEWGVGGGAVNAIC